MLRQIADSLAYATRDHVRGIPEKYRAIVDIATARIQIYFGFLRQWNFLCLYLLCKQQLK